MVWQRILALHTGIGIYSVAIIVASFMAGLGAGSHLGGILSSHLTPRRALRQFALVEGGVGAFGAASTWLYYDLLYLKGAGLYRSGAGAAALHFLALLLPTLLMGMSLPLLVRAFLRRAEHAGRTIGFLYGINVLGAAVGAWLAPWILMRYLGLRGATLVGACLNLLAAAGAVAVDRIRILRAVGDDVVEPLVPFNERADGPGAPGLGATEGGLHTAADGRQTDAGQCAAGLGPTGDGRARPGVVAGATPVIPDRKPFGLWVSLYALSGFIALALEILWFRIVDVGVKSSAFTFGTVLALYLAGSAVGALAGSSLAHRLQRPLEAFASLQVALLAWAAGAVTLLCRLPADTPGLAWFFDYWGRASGFKLGTMSDGESLVLLYLVLPVVLFGVPTVLMGLSFPVLQRAVHDDVASGSRRVGLLQAANIAGCTAGSLLVGLVLLNVLGTAGTLRTLPLTGLVFVVVIGHERRRLAAAFGLVLLVSASVVPSNDTLWRRFHGARELEGALFEEDATSVVALAPLEAGLWQVFVNGKSHSMLPFQEGHTLLGAVPALVHPNPKTVALIGLGSANTAWAVACRRETEFLDVFEIAGPQFRVLRRFDEERALFPKLHRILNDPRLRVVTADGRNAIERGEQRYDLIEADALWPYTAYSGNLYSEEFFGRCARRLERGGVMCTWAPTRRVYATFSRVFPNVLDAGSILVGSLEPLSGTGEEWAKRAESPQVAQWLGPLSVRIVQRALRRAAPLPRRPVRDADVDQDLFPRDELATP